MTCLPKPDYTGSVVRGTSIDGEPGGRRAVAMSPGGTDQGDR
jgi:hypothetical protein